MQNEFKQLPQRWYITFIYILLTVFNGIASKNVPPIATKLQQIFDVDPFFINAVPMSYLLIYGIINLPANYFIDSKGIRLGLIIGSLLFTIGTVIEIFVNYNFVFLIIGSIFVAISQPFILNCPAKIATFWFKKENRTLVTAVLSLLSIIGSGVGILLPTLFINEDSVGDIAKNQLFIMLITQSSLSILALLLILAFMKDKPDIMPSLGSEIQKVSFLESIRRLWQNVNFRLIFMGFLLFNGPLTTLVSVMNFIFKPFQFMDVQISAFGIAIIVFGIIGSIIFSVVISKTLKYKLIIRILTGFSIIVIGFCIYSLKYILKFILVLVLLALGGFFVMPVTPLSFDFGCELVFPVGEAQITGMLISSGSLTSFILIIIIQTTIGFGTQDQSLKIFVGFFIIMCVGVVFYWLIQNDLKRRVRQDMDNTSIINLHPQTIVPVDVSLQLNGKSKEITRDNLKIQNM